MTTAAAVVLDPAGRRCSQADAVTLAVRAANMELAVGKRRALKECAGSPALGDVTVENTFAAIRAEKVAARALAVAARTAVAPARRARRGRNPWRRSCQFVACLRAALFFGDYKVDVPFGRMVVSPFRLSERGNDMATQPSDTDPSGYDDAGRVCAAKLDKNVYGFGYDFCYVIQTLVKHGCQITLRLYADNNAMVFAYDPSKRDAEVGSGSWSEDDLGVYSIVEPQQIGIIDLDFADFDALRAYVSADLTGIALKPGQLMVGVRRDK